MYDKIAVKRLTGSDLTIFKAQLGISSQSKQKAINLNADPFTTEMYPDLAGSVSPVPVIIKVLGPGGADAHVLTRKIVPPTGGYKNWRLNGEVISDLDDQPDRFSKLKAGDVAVLAFKGARKPESLDVYLLSQADPGDTDVAAALTAFLAGPPGNSLKTMQQSDLEAMLDAAGKPISDALRSASLSAGDADVEQAALGDPVAAAKLAKRGRGRALSAADLARARERASQIGRLGEEIINTYLKSETDAGKIKSYKWVSDENAVAPYDFEIALNDGSKQLIDVKTTDGEHDRAIHLSAAEVISAAQGGSPYRLYRVSAASAGEPILRVSQELRDICESIILVTNALPTGIRADGFTMQVADVEWGPAIQLSASDDD